MLSNNLASKITFSTLENMSKTILKVAGASPVESDMVSHPEDILLMDL